jgi:hypothetical protein
MTDNAKKLSGVRVGGMGVLYPACFALLPQQSADVGHIGVDRPAENGGQ